MFSKKKRTKPDTKRGKKTNSNMGIYGLEGYGIVGNSSVEEDKELEAELYSLIGEIPIEDESVASDSEEDLDAELNKILGIKKSSHKMKTSNKIIPETPIPVKELLQKLDSGLIEGDSDEDADENDEELLSELMDLTMEDNAQVDEECPDIEPKRSMSVVDVLKERLEMYKEAEATAKNKNEMARARRFNRGIKTLETLLKTANSGKPVNPNDIPPALAKNLKHDSNVNLDKPPVMLNENIGTDSDISKFVQEMPDDSFETPEVELDEHKPANKEPETPPVVNVLPLAPRRSVIHSDDSEKPLEDIRFTPANPSHMSIHTISEIKSQDVSKEQPVNSKTTESKNIASTSIDETTNNVIENPKLIVLQKKRDNLKTGALKAKKEGNLQLALQLMKEAKEIERSIVEEQSSDKSKGTQTKEMKFEIPVGRNLIEALEQRLEKYVGMQKAAKSSNDDARVRRYNRIVRQYSDSLSMMKAGKKVALDTLPNPPGFPPLPKL